MLMDRREAYTSCTPSTSTTTALKRRRGATCHFQSKQPDLMFAYELAICQTFYFLSSYSSDPLQTWRDDILAHLTRGETSCVLLSLQITLSTQQIKSNIFHSYDEEGPRRRQLERQRNVCFYLCFQIKRVILNKFLSFRRPVCVYRCSECWCLLERIPDMLTDRQRVVVEANIEGIWIRNELLLLLLPRFPLSCVHVSFRSICSVLWSQSSAGDVDLCVRRYVKWSGRDIIIVNLQFEMYISSFDVGCWMESNVLISDDRVTFK